MLTLNRIIKLKMSRHLLLTVAAICFGMLVTISAQADAQIRDGYLQREDVQAFIGNMVSKHGFKRSQLEGLFAAIEPKPGIIESISHPAEAKPWYKYRPIFIQESRITGGVDFWNKHVNILERAEKQYGVPAEIIVAIIGVETRYGHYTGRHKVFESLVTLGFDYPKRGRFFRNELSQYLILTREEGIDPLSLKGSYAGAMGMPQFISSSYRRYAVDFDGDGKRDLHNNISDVIGSVANYFKVHGWQAGDPVISRATVAANARIAVIPDSLKPALTLEELKRLGVTSTNSVTGNPKASLISLEQPNAMEYWLGFKNFYVITRYNHSPLYAMAAYQLAELIRSRRQDS
ncbi:MAG TPA: lytic murein transglycosylase B [Gammaproteobacteria bacterium]|nr:lytic murein transglycosylase B [Gammaproteobacteria bacterium]